MSMNPYYNNPNPTYGGQNPPAYTPPAAQGGYTPGGTQDGALGWDDEITANGDDNAFVVLPAGDYPFTVKRLSKGWHEGSAKIPPCHKAIIELEIAAPDGRRTTITENIMLHSILEWKIAQYFECLGMKQKGTPYKPDWMGSIGRQGTCRIYVNTYTGKDGNQYQNNKIKAFLPAGKQ